MSSYEKEQERLAKLMDECLRENDSKQMVAQYDDQSDEDEEDRLEITNYNSDTDQDISDEEVPAEDSPGPYFLGKDQKSQWMKHVPRKNVKTRSENIIKHLPGAKAVTRNLRSRLEIWQHFIDFDIIRQIVVYTNQHIETVQSKYSRDRDCRLTDVSEIQALIGLLYLSGVTKSSRLNVDELWSKLGTGIEIFRLAMGKNRFLFLLQHLRFDNLETRSERMKMDKLAPIRDLFDAFVHKCGTAYTPFENVTIDEKLEAFRGRCGFRQYMPNKPNKYGIKIFALADSKTFYAMNLEVYVGKQPDGPYAVDNSASAVVQRMCKSIKGSGRNVTCDNWFSGIDLVKCLLQDYGLTFLGTIRKNKRELPIEFSCPSKRPVASSMFAFHKDITLVSYIPKQSKNVLLVSSTHHDDNVDQETGKPEMILDYNATKGGVDTLDKLCATYDCARNTRRWPMVIFYSILNVAGINSMVLYFANNTDIHIPRRQFLRELSFDLLESHLRTRTHIQNLPPTLKARIRELTGEEIPGPSSETLTNVRGRCAYCDRKKNRPTRITCKKCRKFMCGEHSLHICHECYSENIISQ